MQASLSASVCGYMGEWSQGRNWRDCVSKLPVPWKLLQRSGEHSIQTRKYMKASLLQPQGKGKYSFPSINCKQEGDYVVSTVSG